MQPVARGEHSSASTVTSLSSVGRPATIWRASAVSGKNRLRSRSKENWPRSRGCKFPFTIPQYLAASGQDQQAFVDGVREGAAGAVRADLALRAVVAQEAIEVTDEEVDAEVDQLAERLGEKPAKVRKDLERRGVVQAVRSDLERSKALSFLIEHATVVDEDGNPVDLSPPELETADTETAETEAESEAEAPKQPLKSSAEEPES